MLPDFPELKKQLRLLLRRRLRQSFDQEVAVISLCRHLQSHEGDTFTIQRLDGSSTTRSYQETESQLTIDKKDLPTLTPRQLVAKVDNVASEMAEKVERNMFEKLREAVSKVGNVVDARGQPISSELFLESIEKIQMDFEEDGMPCWPTMVVGPELGEALKTLMPQWESDPEFRRKREALLNRKREEWRDRESRRKLVD